MFFLKNRLKCFFLKAFTDRRLLGWTDIRNWIRNIEQHATENVSKILIGNKCDMTDKRVVEYAAGKALADEYGIRFLETSAKNSINVEEAFFSLAREIKKKVIDTVPPAATGPTLRSGARSGIQLGQGGQGGRTSTSCCSSS